MIIAKLLVKTKKAITEIRKANRHFKVFKYLLIVLFFMTVFIVMTYWYVIDVEVLKDFIFINHFSLRKKFFEIIGYSVATICFIAYLLLADKAIRIDSEIKIKKLYPPKFYNQISKVRSAFNYTFIFSALILSIFVVWMGVLYNAINSLELPNYYLQISGQHFLNPDFVYLFGLFHSLLLLIFYLPVQIQFNSLEIVQALKLSDTEGMTTSKKLYTSLFESLSSILITASPLISSFSQNLFSSFMHP